jgi:ribosomal protein L7/L12
MSSGPACPSCGSTDVVKASVAYEQGVHRSASTTAGLGVGTGGTVGLGGGRTRGTSVSLAAQRNAPPQPSTLPATVGMAVWLGVIVLGYSFSHIPGTWWAAPLVGLVLGLVAALRTGAVTERDDREKRVVYADTWYCNRCGHQFWRSDSLGGQQPAHNGPASDDQIPTRPSTFSVVLDSPPTGSALIHVIKEVRVLRPELGLREAVDRVKAAPFTVLRGASKQVAERASQQIVAAGGSVRVTLDAGSPGA